MHHRLQQSSHNVCVCKCQCASVYTPHPCQFSAFDAISEVMTGNHQQGDLNKQSQ